MGPNGVVTTLDLATLPNLEAEAIAVFLLFAFRDPSHERLVAEELRRLHPEAHVVASHEVAPELREYERASTTAADAYLGPVAGSYLRALGDAAAAAGLPQPLVMRSSGGVASLGGRRDPPCARSGLRPGRRRRCRGAHRRPRRLRECDRIRHGGTSTDVCLIAGGRAERTEEREVGGFPIRLPMVDVHTVGAGGGSIVWWDAGGALRVGPRSAGAAPGPACYGRGGAEATVTT